MKIEKFEDIIAWQKAKTINIFIYNNFSNRRDFCFKDQIQRASISIMNNIAEGYERMTNKEFRNFLFIAKGSCAELRSMLYIVLELKYISKENFDRIYSLSLEVSKMLFGLIKTL